MAMKTIKKKLSGQNGIDFAPTDEPDLDKYLRQTAYWVGYFIFEFNEFEHTVTEILSLHIGGGDQTVYQHIFLTGLNFNQKVELLERIYSHEITFLVEKSSQENVKKKCKEIIAELKNIGGIRNNIVHANYYSLDKNGYVREKTKFSDSDAIEKWVSITRDFLVENINRIIDFSERLDDFDLEFH